MTNSTPIKIRPGVHVHLVRGETLWGATHGVVLRAGLRGSWDVEATDGAKPGTWFTAPTDYLEAIPTPCAGKFHDDPLCRCRVIGGRHLCGPGTCHNCAQVAH